MSSLSARLLARINACTHRKDAEEASATYAKEQVAVLVGEVETMSLDDIALNRVRKKIVFPVSIDECYWDNVLIKHITDELNAVEWGDSISVETRLSQGGTGLTVDVTFGTDIAEAARHEIGLT